VQAFAIQKRFFVALLVIVCGALLVIGGAISLLLGFDIVMTERGSAMTLGGVIALSGGVIAVGIGFALLRLSQILAALQERNLRGVRPVVTQDRPVIPPVSAESVNSGDIPPSPAAEAGISRIGLGAGVVAAGVVASAAGFAATKSDNETLDTGVATARLPDAPAVADTEIPDMPELSPSETAIASPPSLASIPDLEEELARALAEPEVEPLSAQVREKSFADGLTDLLGKPKGRKRKPEPEQEVQPESELDQDLATIDVSDPDPIAEVSAGTAGMDGGIFDAGLPDVSAMMEDVSAVDTAVDPIAAVPDTLAAAISELAHPPSFTAETDMTIAPQTAPVSPSKKVLGTYNAGGRTYSMYADGSVEAVTENGVERFNSMDELRRHLVRI
jgi:hypothetical protein